MDRFVTRGAAVKGAAAKPRHARQVMRERSLCIGFHDTTWYAHAMHPVRALQATLESLGKVVIMPTSTLGFGAEDLQRLKHKARAFAWRTAPSAAARRTPLSAPCCSHAPNSWRTSLHPAYSS
jgi:hypothetical protein